MRCVTPIQIYINLLSDIRHMQPWPSLQNIWTNSMGMSTRSSRDMWCLSIISTCMCCRSNLRERRYIQARYFYVHVRDHMHWMCTESLTSSYITYPQCMCRSKNRMHNNVDQHIIWMLHVNLQVLQFIIMSINNIEHTWTVLMLAFNELQWETSIIYSQHSINIDWQIHIISH